MPARERDEATIENWLVAWIAKEMGLDPSAIDARQPLLNFGMGSRQALLLVGDLEDWLGTKVDPTLAWDHPTIEKISRFLATEVNRAAGDGQRP
jgi:acyl carrier protein